MSRPIKRVAHFARKLIDGQYPVIPPPQVPSHIIKPQYAQNPQNPIYALYQGKPQILTSQMQTSIKKAARIAADTLQAAQRFLIKNAQQNIKNGTDGTITGQDVDKFVFNYIVSKNAYPTPIGFIGFPKSVCLSINQCLVHGIPSTRPIYLGDKINMDVTSYFDGFHGDTNLSMIYGGQNYAPTPQVNAIIPIAQKILYKAISICKPGVRFNQIGKTIQRAAQDNDIHVCPHFTGHGVGQLLHMPPYVFHVYYPSQRDIMMPGNAFTIQPVVSWYQSQTGLTLWKDGLTAISDNNPNAQFQHMVLITQDGCQVLTQRQNQNIPNPNGNIKNLKIY